MNKLKTHSEAKTHFLVSAALEAPEETLSAAQLVVTHSEVKPVVSAIFLKNLKRCLVGEEGNAVVVVLIVCRG